MRIASSFPALLALTLLAPACLLFTDAIPCSDDEGCPGGRCDAERKVCVLALGGDDGHALHVVDTDGDADGGDATPADGVLDVGEGEGEGEGDIDEGVPVARPPRGDGSDGDAPVLDDAGSAADAGDAAGAPDAGSEAVSDDAGSPPPPPPPPLVERVTSGLVALYTFNGTGAVVADVSGVSPALDLTIADATRGVQANGTLTFTAATRAETSGAAGKVNFWCAVSGEITLESWAKPAVAAQAGPARIATVSSGLFERNVTLSQGVYFDDATAETFSFRYRTDATGDNGLTAGDVNLTPHTPPGSARAAAQHIVFTRDEDGEVNAYVDGALVLTTEVPGDTGSWDDDFALALGNETQVAPTSIDRAWLGSLDLVAVYCRALDAGAVAQNFAAGPR